MARTKVNKDHPAFTTETAQPGVVTTDILAKEPVKGGRKAAGPAAAQQVSPELEKLLFLRDYLEASLKDVKDELEKFVKG